MRTGLSSGFLLLGLSILVLSMVGPGRAFADVWRPAMTAVDSNGFASDDQVQASVGNLTIDVDCPSRRFTDAMQRGAKVTLEKSGYHDPGVVSTILRDALSQIWSQCDTAMGSFGNGVGYVDIYAPLQDGATPQLVIHADKFIDLVGYNQFTKITDVIAQQQQAAADAAQQQAAAYAAQQQAAAQAAQQAQQAAAYAAQQQASAQWWSDTWQTIKGLFWIAVFVAVAVWLFNRREPIARWYYFTFHPHPAEALVDAAISSSAPLNGKALASALSELPPGNSIFRGVRLEQAERLFGQMQRVSEARIREQKLRAQEGYERAALDSIQEAVALAAVALERAKALYRASQAVRGSA